MQMQPTRDRRSFLRTLGAAGAGGAALAAGTVPVVGLVGTAAATGATLTTAADTEVLTFLRGVEIAYGELYAEAAVRGRAVGDDADLLALFGAHHEEAAASLGALAGGRGVRNDAVRKRFYTTVAVAADATELFAALYKVEQSCSATHLDALAHLESAQASSAVAAIVPAAAQRAVVLGTRAGLALTAVVPAFEGISTAATLENSPA